MNAEQPPSDARQIGRRIRLIENIYRFPYWFLGLTVIAVLVILLIAQNQTYSNIFNQLVEGIIVTLRVSIQAYFAAFFIGLIIGLIRALTVTDSITAWANAPSVARRSLGRCFEATTTITPRR